MRFFTICKFIIILLFFYAPSALAVTYHPTYEAAHAAEPCQTGLINQGDCWRGIKCGNKPVEHVYPRCDHAESCKDEFLSKLGFDPCNSTPCVWTLDLDTTGPGSATASKSSADCAETITITVVPDNEFVTWSVTNCSAHCVTSGNTVEVTSNTAGDVVDVDITFTEGEPAKIHVNVSGPGYVGGSACDQEIKCPGGNCSAESPSLCSATLTAYPNMQGVEVEITTTGNCSVTGNSVACIVNPGETASIVAIFGDICTTDSDGDGIYDYADFHKDDPEWKVPIKLEKAFLSVEAEPDVYPIFEKIVDFFMGVGSVTEQYLQTYLHDDEFLDKTYFVFGDKDSGSDVVEGEASKYGIGNDEVLDNLKSLVIECDPRFQYCGSLSNYELQKYIPCSEKYPIDPILTAEIKEPSEVPDIDTGIPDGIYETPDSSCSCFATVNHNTAATVDQLKNLAEINHSIASNTEKTVEQLNTTNKLLEKIANKSFGGGGGSFNDEDDFDDGDVQNVIDALNDDADSVDDDIEAIENNNENKAIASYDDTSNDELEGLINTEGQGYKDDITQYNDNLNSFISGKFQVSVSNPTCTFSAPVFGGRNIQFNGCNYAGPLGTMGAFIKFISYLTAIVIILRA